MRPLLLDGIRQLLRKSLDPAAANQEFIIVTHSLGSYLILDALDPSDTDASLGTGSLGEFDYVLSHTSMIYFFANQLRLLELANLDKTDGSAMAAHLNAWGRARCGYLESHKTPDDNLSPPQLVAWNDPSDLLTWSVPNLDGVVVRNYVVRNTTNWLWLLANPSKAHDRYALNEKVVHEMLKPAPARDGGMETTISPCANFTQARGPLQVGW